MSPPRPRQMPTTPMMPPIGPRLVKAGDAPKATPKGAALRLPTAGEQFDKYTLLAKLATGGMAELFVAELSGAAGFCKKVVIKRILPHVAHDEHFTRMFLDEAKTCAQINHPNVCQVFELCETQGTHFLVLEHLEGATVGELIRRSLVSEQALNRRLAAGIIVQACDGLHAAHEQVDEEGRNSNLVHRDVSPGNLFVTVDGIVKVLDFGIAKARWMSRKTKTGTLLGKCEYMSPEQARGGVPLDRRSDIFSLGIIAWELVCGKRLFRRESEYETLRAVLRAPIERPISIRPAISPALDEAIMRALERDPGDRYRTAYEFRQAISDALRESGGPTPMCDIAPLIRSSFCEELKIQRAVLKQASKTADTSANALPRMGSMPPMNEGDENFANTDVLTAEHQRLPSLEEETEDLDSVELTFRVLPKETPAVAAPLTDLSTSSGTVAANPNVEPAKKPRGASRTSAPPPVPASRVDAEAKTTSKSDSATSKSEAKSKAEAVDAAVFSAQAAAVVAAVPEATTKAHDGRTTVLWLALTLLLGGAVTTGSLMFFRKNNSKAAPSITAAKPATTAPTSLAPPATPKPERQTKPALAPAPIVTDAGSAIATSGIATSGIATSGIANSAIVNAAAQARLLEENQKAKAVVTALPSTNKSGAEFGTIEILSNHVGKVYLYPEKTLLGTTPLTHALPIGRHKLKVEIGQEKGQKKYFHLKVEANKTTIRSLNHW